MHTVTIHEAKTHLSRLIQESLAGEEVIIAKGKVPLVKIQPLEQATKKRQLDTAKGMLIYMADDFDAPLDEFSEYM